MDYGALPPEINSGRMYAGPGSGPMLAAASAWAGLAAELNSTAASYESVIAGLTAGSWVGSSSTAMADAAGRYVAWLSTTGAEAELASTQAQAVAGAFDAAFAMTVPPPVIAANRAQLATLIATNFLGQNSSAIAATEAEYAEMWAQDAAAMYGYAANSAAATTQMTSFTAPPKTTNEAGVAAQGAASAQSGGTSTGTSTSDLMSSISTALHTLASPMSAATHEAANVGTTGTTITPFGTIGSSLAAEYGYLPGFAAMIIGANALGPLFNPDVFLPFMSLAGAAAPVAEVVGATAPAGLASGVAGGWGGLSALGQAASVGGLSVPSSWGWAAAAPGGMPVYTLASAAAPLGAADLGAGLGFPFMFGPLQRAAAVGAGAGAAAGATAARFGPRLKVLGRSPAAGYADESSAARGGQTPKYPAPAGLPLNAHAPPGYKPAIVYVPDDGSGPSDG